MKNILRTQLQHWRDIGTPGGTALADALEQLSDERDGFAGHIQRAEAQAAELMRWWQDGDAPIEQMRRLEAERDLLLAVAFEARKIATKLDPDGCRLELDDLRRALSRVA